MAQMTGSHSSWVRGLKCIRKDRLVGGLDVALLVSAWIEIHRTRHYFRRSTSRTPRECVDWNMTLWFLLTHRTSRTPRECVDWNFTWIFLFYFSGSVALLVSAWIEIDERLQIEKEIASHSSWVRGLKCYDAESNVESLEVALLVSAWIEIIRDNNCFKSFRSHSSWVRGLK